MTWLWILAGLIVVGTLLFALALCRVSAQADAALEQMRAVDDPDSPPAPELSKITVDGEQLEVTRYEIEVEP